MVATKVSAIRAEQAHGRAQATIEKHCSDERRDMLKEMTAIGIPNTRRTEDLVAYQAEMISALAEMVEDLYQSKAAAKKKAS